MAAPLIRPSAGRQAICMTCLLRYTLPRGARATLSPIGLQNSDRIGRRWKGYIAPEGGQANPLRGFYTDLSHTSSQPTPATKIPPPKLPLDGAPSPPAPLTLESTTQSTTKEAASSPLHIIFGSPLTGPGSRRDEIARNSSLIDGVLVPPKPDEPDNCCMSGCVNCVWEMYREDVEEWAAKMAEAKQSKLRKGGPQADKRGGIANPAAHDAGSSMDDDGGGSSANWETGLAEDVFSGIPVGIRQFMETEKMLKQRRLQQKTAEQ